MNRFIFQAIAAPIDDDVFIADDAIEIPPPILEGLHARDLRDHEDLIPAFDWFNQEPAFARVRQPLVQEGIFVLVEFIDPPTYVYTSWPFSGRINVDNWPSHTLFYFEVEADTDDPLAPASCRLWNITDGVPVPGSVVTSWAPHTTPVDPATFVRSNGFNLYGDKRYRAERGGPSGSGATIHLHSSRVIAIY